MSQLLYTSAISDYDLVLKFEVAAIKVHRILSRREAIVRWTVSNSCINVLYNNSTTFEAREFSSLCGIELLKLDYSPTDLILILTQKCFCHSCCYCP